MNVASNMSQETKILMEDMLGMDPLMRAWHEIYRERIDKEVLAAQEASVSVFTVEPTTVVEVAPTLATMATTTPPVRWRNYR
jgi:hypothetical protein